LRSGHGLRFVERRSHPRSGALTLVEDITYSVLREHELESNAALGYAEGWQQRMVRNFAIVARNENVERNENYPRSWHVYSGDHETELDVDHDGNGKPVVRARVTL
jgi:hypothetical protein